MNTSFFIPAYNCSETIEESVNSIMGENFSDGDELVVVNDCSTDSTTDVLQKLQARYPLIKVFHNHRNKGGAATRNIAIEHCIHPVVFCLDSDNILAPSSIHKLKQFMNETDADVASFQELFYFRKNVSEVDFKWTFKTGIYSIEDHFSTKQVPGASGNYMFTKESWLKAGQYPEFAGALDTWGFGLRQVMSGAKIHVMPNSFYFHRYSHESYWMRDAESRKSSVSLRALQILMPFFDQIDDKDIDYMMSPEGRYTWFNNLEKHHIRLINKVKKRAIWKKNSNDENNQNTNILLSKVNRAMKKLANYAYNITGKS